MKSLISDLGSMTAIIGAQWGDEGKGKVTDILGAEFDVIARACGGANAGHTIVVGGKKHVFHLLPAGCLHEGKPVVLGSGMVIHLPTLLQEIQTLKDAGIDLLPRLHISSAAHVLFDYHKAIDGVIEDRRSKAVGTTRRGIGPAYMDKAARSGIRMGEIVGDITSKLEEKKESVKTMYGIDIDVAMELKNIKLAQEKLASCIITSQVNLMKEYLLQKKTILIEGAQATLLDLDHGTYPYVTSSFTTSAGALQGLGLPPSALKSCIGVAKAYCTRVGGGDFLTEDEGEKGERLRKRGGEYGSTTGRPRRCGWLHLPDLASAAFINGFTCFNVTKLDVLDEEEGIPVGVGTLQDSTAEYKILPGWQVSTAGIRSWDKLPKEAQNYILHIEKYTGVPVRLIGTGPSRDDMIIR